MEICMHDKTQTHYLDLPTKWSIRNFFPLCFFVKSHVHDNWRCQLLNRVPLKKQSPYWRGSWEGTQEWRPFSDFLLYLSLGMEFLWTWAMVLFNKWPCQMVKCQNFCLLNINKDFDFLEGSIPLWGKHWPRFLTGCFWISHAIICMKSLCDHATYVYELYYYYH